MLSLPFWIGIAVAIMSAVLISALIHLNKIYSNRISGSPLLISIPLICSSLLFAMFNLPHPEEFLLAMTTHVVAIIIICLLYVSSWANGTATMQHITTGTVIGLLSTMVPTTILWVVMTEFTLYSIRGVSIRNIGSQLTGIGFGIWIVFAILFLFDSSQSAFDVLYNYRTIFDHTAQILHTDLGWTSWLYVAFAFFIQVIYSISGITYNVGHNLQTQGAISVTSLFSIILIVIMILDFGNLYIYLPVLTSLTALQISILNSNLQQSINDTVTSIVVVLLTALALLPAVLSIDYNGINTWLQQHSIL